MEARTAIISDTEIKTYHPEAVLACIYVPRELLMVKIHWSSLRHAVGK